MAKPESQFIVGVHKYLNDDTHGLLVKDNEVYSMKNHNEYIGGIFDCWYSARPKDLWIEYKFVVLPKRDETLVVPELSALQLAWGRARVEEGRNCWVIIGAKDGGIILPFEHQWDRPITTGMFKQMMLKRRQLAERITNFVTRP